MNFKKNPVVIFTYRKYFSLHEILLTVNQYKPSKLYIVCDFPQGESNRLLVKKVRNLLASFDFESEVNFIEPEINQGVLNIFDYALDIIFQKEEQLIILEDDTIPSPLFFSYCNSMLEKYKHDQSIGCIVGSNLGVYGSPNQYFTSRISLPFWGWATWADRWRAMPKSGDFWDNFQKQKHSNLAEETGINSIVNIFNYARKYPKSWDTKWAMHLLYENKKTILPGVNLITNTGYNNLATFTNINNSKFSNQLRFDTVWENCFFENLINLEDKYILSVLDFMNEFKFRLKE